MISKNTLVHLMDNLVDDKGDVVEASYFVLNTLWFDFTFKMSEEQSLAHAKETLRQYDALWTSAVDEARDFAWKYWHWPDFLLMMLERRGSSDPMIGKMVYEWGMTRCSDHVKHMMTGFSAN